MASRYDPFSEPPAEELPALRSRAQTVRQMLDLGAIRDRIFGGDTSGSFEPLADEGGGFARRGHTVNAGLRRGKTLYKPSRQPTQKRLIEKTTDYSGPWPTFAKTVTCCFPGVLLSRSISKDYRVQQAWREKVALCFIIFLISAALAFFTLGLKELLCSTAKQEAITRNPVTVETFGTIVINGVLYNKTTVFPEFSHMFEGLPPGFSVSDQFVDPPAPSCANLPANLISNPVVTTINTCYGEGGCLPTDATIRMTNLTAIGNPVYGWRYLYRTAPRIRNMIVMNNAVLDLTQYFIQHPQELNNPIDSALRSALRLRDATILQRNNPDLAALYPCLREKYGVGLPGVEDTGCLIITLVFYLGLLLVMGVVLARFSLAIMFDWFLSHQLSRMPDPSTLPLRSAHDSKPSPVPLLKEIGGAIELGPLKTRGVGSLTPVPFQDNPLEPYVVTLVTCYSEGTESLENTFDSIAATDYHDDRKLLLVIADGVVQGKGNPKPTPDLVVDMMDLDISFGNPKPYSSIAVASGSKQHNMAKVYVGHYRKKGRNVPTVLVAKCGTPEELEAGGKPGNRGKRDSQLILMNFFRRCILGERMTPLDFDLFRKIHHVMGATPDRFEIVLMVDADTKIHTDSLKMMTRAMLNDPRIMGLCGETKIANKTQSWVTAIQVFEYYISHHLGKSFESVFGGVTCLPGCFCMYRLKAYKDGTWIPILVAPDIVDQYSTNETDTLHQKNLLLLGEDRFLSTLMLRQFPNRKMVFVPRATCKTTVPDDFKTLLSQRRRWINSTVHNLMELVLVNNLCGTFCFSMQFVVFLDMLGTTILPVSTLMLYYLIVNAIITVRGSMASGLALAPAQILPLAMLLVSLLLPSVLVLLTAKRISYLGWMILFLLALPIWQIILPLYAFWHFDDFSWGATRQVTGAGAGKDDHGGGEGEFDARVVPFKRWEEYERAWRQSLLNKRGTSPRPSTQGSDSTLAASKAASASRLPSRTNYEDPREYHDSYNDADETAGLAANAAEFGRASGPARSLPRPQTQQIGVYQPPPHFTALQVPVAPLIQPADGLGASGAPPPPRFEPSRLPLAGELPQNVPRPSPPKPQLATAPPAPSATTVAPRSAPQPIASAVPPAGPSAVVVPPRASSFLPPAAHVEATVPPPTLTLTPPTPSSAPPSRPGAVSGFPPPTLDRQPSAGVPSIGMSVDQLMAGMGGPPTRPASPSQLTSAPAKPAPPQEEAKKGGVIDSLMKGW